MKKIYLVLVLCAASVLGFSQQQGSTKADKREQRRQQINQLMREEEEGALVYSKQTAFGVKLSTDGYGIFFEHGKYKTIRQTNLWWIELSEHKNPKEEKFTLTDQSGFFIVGNPYIFGKINNFYCLKAGIGGQRLIGGKGNKNGVAVSAIYGAGLSAGLLKPYYISITDSVDNHATDIKYSPETDASFRDPGLILGSSGFTKGFNEIKFTPGAHARFSLRFDYGRFNELLSAIEVGVNAEYYSKPMQIMLDVPGKKFFFNSYVAIVFGKRK